METIPKANCQKIGFFRKTHGIHGEVVLEFEEHFEYSVEEAFRFFIELEGLLVPFFILEDGLRFRNSSSVILTFDGVETDKYAKRFIGNSAYLFKEEIIDDEEAPGDSKLLGYKISDVTLGEIGTVEQMDDYSGNKVITTHFNNEELLIPFNENMLVEMDDEEKIIRLNLPEGLVE